MISLPPGNVALSLKFSPKLNPLLHACCLFFITVPLPPQFNSSFPPVVSFLPSPRDGSDANARLIETVPLNNYTRPESVVTTGNNLFLVFRADKEVRTEVFLEVTAGRAKAPDLNVTGTLVEGNSGRGIWVEAMRSGVHVHKSTVRAHNHVAGVNVNWGAGDVNITHSDIVDNFVDGVNITYGGGNRNISWSKISDNVGMGVAIYLNETTVNHPVRQETVVAYSNISLNYDIGVLVGNFCGPAIVNISGNHFESGRYVGLEVLSCWRDSDLEGVARGNMHLQGRVTNGAFRRRSKLLLRSQALHSQIRFPTELIHSFLFW